MLVPVARAAGPRDADHPLRRPRQSCLGGQLPAARLPLQVDLLHHLLVQLPLPDLQHLADAAARRAAARRDPTVIQALATLPLGRSDWCRVLTPHGIRPGLRTCCTILIE